MYRSVTEMNEVLINNWNGVVKKGDLVYFLGDFGFPPKMQGTALTEIINELNGHIWWVMGNHDYKNEKALDLPRHTKHKIVGMGDIAYVKLSANKQRVFLCHYPMESWRSSCHGVWSMHGHTHEKNRITGRNRLHIGVDAWDYTPVSEAQVIKIMTENQG